jgi:hypothetical protein
MEKCTQYETGQVIYPGQYVPILNEEEIQKEIKHTLKTESVFPKVNITELADSYIAELDIPGVNRQDFLVHTDNNILSVCVLHKGCSQKVKSNLVADYVIVISFCPTMPTLHLSVQNILQAHYGFMYQKQKSLSKISIPE